jgi:Spy/CpxP family protein refolding chaperone
MMSSTPFVALVALGLAFFIGAALARLAATAVSAAAAASTAYRFLRPDMCPSVVRPQERTSLWQRNHRILVET